MAVINTNVKALFSQAALRATERSQQVSMQQLSTGKRINSSRDDAAGMAISTRMTHQIRSLNQAVRNAGDAITLIQTAEGATNEITDMLQRMRELAVQASNDTNNNEQRSYLDLEFQQLKKQIVQIANNTEWNGFPVLNGTTGERVGIKPVYKTISEPIGNSTPVITESAITSTTDGATGGVTATAVVSFKNLETGQSATYYGLTYTATTPNTAAEVAQNFANLASGAAPTTGTKGTFSGSLGADFSSGDADGSSVTFTANDHLMDIGSLPDNPTGSGSGVVFPTVENTLGVDGGGIEKDVNSGSFIKSGNLSIVMEDDSTIGSAKFTLEDGQIIDIKESTSVAGGVITISKESLDGKGLNLLEDDDFVINQLSVFGGSLDFAANDKVSMSVSRKFQELDSTVAGDAIINGVSIGATQPGIDTVSFSNNIASAITKAAAINEKTALTGVQAVVNPNVMTGAAMSGSDTTTGTISINGYVTPKVETVQNNPRESRALTVAAINFISAKTGVRAIDTFTENKGITLVADDGRNIEVAFNTSSADSDFSRLTGLKMGIQVGTYSLESSVEQPVNVTTATNGNIQRTGLAVNNYNSKTLSTVTTVAREAVAPKYELEFSELAANETVTVAGLTLTADATGMTAAQVAKAFASVAGGQTPSDPTGGVFTGALSDDYSSVAAIGAKVTFTSTAALKTRTDIDVGGDVAPTVVPTGTSVTSLGIGDLKINGVAIRSASEEDDKLSNTQTASSSRLSSAIATVAAINASTAATGVSAVAIPATIEGNVTSTTYPAADGPQSLYINGVNVVVDMSAGEAPAARRQAVVDAINEKSGFSGVEAVDNGNSGITLKAVDGRNVSVWFDSDLLNAGSFGLGVGTDTSNPPGVKGQSGADQEYTGGHTVYGSVALQSSKPIEVETGDNGFTTEGDFTSMGFRVGKFGGEVDEAISKMSPPRTGRLAFQVGANEGQKITIDLADFGQGGPITGEITWDADLEPLPPGSDVPQAEQGGPSLQGKPLTRSFISSSAAAQDVLNKLDVTMDRVNQTRATMGAVMNRLDHVINNLTNVSMNLSASRSQIEDSDYASASTELAKTQIMQQAATAVLAQANTSQQSVLKLLQG